MSNRKRSKPTPNSDSKQTDMFSGLKNLKRLHNKQNKLKKQTPSSKITSPMVMDIMNSDDSEDEIPVNLAQKIDSAKRRLAFMPSDDEDDASSQNTRKEISSICLNRPNQGSLGSDSANNSTISPNKTNVVILQNEIISPVKETNTTGTETPKKIIQSSSPNNENTPQKDNDNTICQRQNTPKSSRKNMQGSSPKKEKERPYGSFLKINNELISQVFQSIHLSKLLDQDDHRMLKNIQKANPKYQYVCFKLYKWSSKWYNLSQFVKRIKLDMEDQEVVNLYEFLKSSDIAETDYLNEKTDFLLNLIDANDIKDICKKYKIYVPKTVKGANGKSVNNNRKKTLIDLIMEKCTKQPTLTFSKSIKDLITEEIVCKLGKHVVRIKDNFKKSFQRVFILATFSNPMFYDIDEFFRQMTTNIEFPSYQVNEHQVFYTKSEFFSYVDARYYKDKIDYIKETIEFLQMGRDVFKHIKELHQNSIEDDIERYVNTPHLRRFTAQSVYTSVLSSVSEKLVPKYPNEVQEWLEYMINEFPDSHKLGFWSYHLCRIFQNLKKPESASKLLITILRDKRNCLSELQIANLGERGQILKPKINQYLHDELIELLPSPLNPEDFPETTIDQKTIRGNPSGRRRDYVVIDAEGNKTYKKVEEIALDYYIDQCGYTGGVHCEGSIINALFALFFWDLIYNPEVLVPGTFLSDKQFYPLDLFTPYFYTNRKEVIDQRLRDIEGGWLNRKLLTFIKNNWQNYSHITNFIPINEIIKDTDFLEVIVRCIGRCTLSKIFQRLVKNIRELRSGMPDLLIWDSNQDKAKFVEVKGENDKLSMKQKLWLKYLQSVGANIEVCYVHSIGSKKKIKKGEKKTPEQKTKKNISEENSKSTDESCSNSSSVHKKSLEADDLSKGKQVKKAKRVLFKPNLTSEEDQNGQDSGSDFDNQPTNKGKTRDPQIKQALEKRLSEISEKSFSSHSSSETSNSKAESNQTSTSILQDTRSTSTTPTKRPSFTANSSDSENEFSTPSKKRSSSTNSTPTKKVSRINHESSSGVFRGGAGTSSTSTTPTKRPRSSNANSSDSENEFSTSSKKRSSSTNSTPTKKVKRINQASSSEVFMGVIGTTPTKLKFDRMEDKETRHKNTVSTPSKESSFSGDLGIQQMPITSILKKNTYS